MPTTELAQILHRRDTAANWLLADPIMGAGEFGVETDTKLVKVGDGTSLWSALTYQSPQLAAQINLAAAKATPVDADTFPLSDSGAANGLKKLTWANLKTTLKAYFDTLYSVVATTVTLTGAQTLTNKTITSPVVTGLYLGDGSIVFEGAVADAFETTVTVQEPTADRTITFPNLDGMLELTSGYTSTPTAAGITVLTVASTKRQVFTGTLAQIVTMPVVSTLPELGYPFKIQNDSTGIVTVNSSGGNLIYAIPAGVTIDVFAILLTGTTAASWLADYPAAATGNTTTTTVRKTSDQTIASSTTLTNDTALLFAVAANEVWHFRIRISAVVAAGGINIKNTCVGPAGSTILWSYSGQVKFTTGSAAGVIRTNASAASDSHYLDNVAGNIEITGIIVNGSTAGNMNFQWAQDTSNASGVTVQTNSSLVATKG